MRCPHCQCLEDKVIDSRIIKEGSGVRRRRECLNCGHRYTTYESVIDKELKVIKRSRNREDFDPDKIRKGIERAIYKRPISPVEVDRIVESIVSSIEQEFDREVKSIEIGKRVMEALKKVDEVAYVRFASVYRQFKDIDQFIEEIRSLATDNDKN